MPMANRRHISWGEIESLTQKLVDMFSIAPGIGLAHYPLRALVGVSRGGLVPLAQLSNRLQIRQPNIGIVHAKSYITTEQQHAAEIQLDKQTEDLLKCRDTLVIDEIYDTGATYQSLQKVFPNPTYAALYRRNGSPDLPGLIWMDNVAMGDWLVFPWEPKNVN